MLRYLPLKCTGCTTTFPFPKGIFSYTSLPPVAAKIGQSLPQFWDVLLMHAWCLRCDRATFVERIPSTKEFMNAAGVRRLRTKRGEHGIDDDLLEIDDVSFRILYEACTNRTSPPKCVLCGTSSYVSIDLQKRETGLKHEACWGSPIINQFFSIGSSNGPPDATGRYLNSDGQVAWVTVSNYQRYKFWLSAVLHFPLNHKDHASLKTAADAILDKDVSVALDLLSPLQKIEDTSALSMLGALHYIGLGVEHDGVRAAELLTMAAEKGDLAALHNLASLHCTGAPGVDQDTEKGWQLFHRAKELGAQFEADDFYLSDQANFYPHFRP